MCLKLRDSASLHNYIRRNERVSDRINKDDPIRITGIAVWTQSMRYGADLSL
jgi:hypothetical protein